MKFIKLGSRSKLKSYLLLLSSKNFGPTHQPSSIHRCMPLFSSERVLLQLEQAGLPTKDPLHTYYNNQLAWEISPHPLFDGEWYLMRNPDVRGKMNPLDHYLMWGFREGRNPNPLFDETWYRSQYLKEDDVPGLLHYASQPSPYENWPNAIFDSPFYGENHPESLDPALTPLGHYLATGFKSSCNPHKYFDNTWYREKYLSGQEIQNIIPLQHFIEWGGANGLDPSPEFDNKGFCSLYSKDMGEIKNPLVFYSQKIREGISLQTQGDGFPNAAELFSASFSDYLARGHDSEHLTFMRSPFSLLSVFDSVESSGGRFLAKFEREKKQLVAPSFLGKTDTNTPLDWVEFPPRYVAYLPEVMCKTGSRIIVPHPYNTILHDAYAMMDSAAESKDFDLYLVNGQARMTPGTFKKYFETAIHLMNEYASNYFHWVIEVLPRLILLDGLDTKKYPVLIQDGLHENFLELLNTVSAGRFNFIPVKSGDWIFVQNLIYPSDVCTTSDVLKRLSNPHDQVLHSKQLENVRNIVHSKYNRSMGSHDRLIYLRRRSGARRIVNELELISQLQQIGFEIIDSDNLNIQQQIDLFNSASIIIAATGAALTNILWCRPGTNIICLMSDHKALNPQLWQQLADISGANLKYFSGSRTYTVVGTYAIHDDFRIDVREFIHLLKKTFSSNVSK